ncbi:hypothetical protein SCUCBS95973_001402 [Sporothrix curviconia]|uniref:Uncharacterized protein n=1 Tax=Sporothrix curviconia TaxID=1260050 RepID=A0ABP0AYH7_9PEZI
MGYDKDTPRKPMLASRPVGRAPLTPKIASTTPTTPSLARTATGPSSSSATSPYQTVTVSTPLARRVTGLSSASSHSSSHNSSSNYGHNNYDSAASPVPSYLNNVTPRSGSRQSRVDSTTPTGTPTSSGNHNNNNTHNNIMGLGIGSASNSSSSSGYNGLASPADPDAKFFYASEAKASSSASASAAAAAASSVNAASASLSSMGPPLASPGLAPSSRPASTFFYANGKSLPSAGGNPLANASVASLPAHLPPNGMASPTMLSSANVSAAGDRSSKFVHANGAALERTPSSSSARRAPVTPTVQQQASRPLSPVKIPAVAPYPLQKSLSFPVVAQTSSSSASPSANGGSSNSSNSSNMHHRPSVPNTLLLNAAASPAGPGAAVASPTSSQPLPGPVSPGSVRLDLLSRQRSNFSASVGSNSSAGGHSRKGSLTIADPPTVARLLHSSQSSQPGSEAPSPASGQFPAYPFPNVTSSPGGSGANAAATSGLAAILQATEDLAGDDDNDNEGEAAEGAGSVNSHGDNDGEGSEHAGGGSSGKDSRRSSTNVSAHPADPNSNSNSSHNPVDELVAIARRERKVQDLEITNASLEAINRSLERQLRKQKNELRQFRRLSRSGRLSLAPLGGDDGGLGSSGLASALPGTLPGGGGSRITSSSTVEGPMRDLDHLLGEDESFDFGDEGEDVDDDNSDMDNPFNEYDHDLDHDNDHDHSSDNDPELDLDNENLTRRKRDERRLQLDLQQHRQLLVDSQKMNQSIKRCMNWTEALIQEGQKALAFQVRVSEVQLGGRVLAADEVEEREQREQREEHEERKEREQRQRNSLEQSGRASLLLEQTRALLDEHHDDEDGGEGEQSLPRKQAEQAELSEQSEPSEVTKVTDIALSSPNSITGPSATPTSTVPSSSSDEHEDRNEAFSPVSHNVRTVRFDDSGDAEIVEVPPAALLPLSLDQVAAVSPTPDTDAAPSTPAKQSLPPPPPPPPAPPAQPAQPAQPLPAAASENPPPIIPETPIQEAPATATAPET